MPRANSLAECVLNLNAGWTNNIIHSKGLIFRKVKFVFDVSVFIYGSSESTLSYKFKMFHICADILPFVKYLSCF